MDRIVVIPMGRDDRDSENPVVTGYMCLTDFEYELGNASDGNKVFPSVDNLRHHMRCANVCGIVEVEVRFKRLVQDSIESLNPIKS